MSMHREQTVTLCSQHRRHRRRTPNQSDQACLDTVPTVQVCIVTVFARASARCMYDGGAKKEFHIGFSPISMIAAEMLMNGADEEMKLPAAYGGELHLTPSFHFVSLKTRRVTADREDEKSQATSLASNPERSSDG